MFLNNGNIASTELPKCFSCVSMEQINCKPINFNDIWREGKV